MTHKMTREFRAGRGTCFAIFTLTLLVLGLQTAYGKDKLAKDLEKIDRNATVDVIVQFKQTPTEAQDQKVKSKGGMDRASLDLIKGKAYSLPVSALRELADDRDVAWISPDRPVKLMMDRTVPAMAADIAKKYGYVGKDVGVTVLDSGVSEPAYLGGRVSYKESLVPYAVADIYGHGTHIAGTIAGTGKDSHNQYRGIAPEAKIINLKVLGDDGVGNDSSVIAGIQKAIELKTKYKIRVINLSLGRPVLESYTQDPLCQAVEAAWKAGIVVVVAAGNEGRNNSLGNQGYATITSPGNDPYVITVGAMKTMATANRGDDLIASYSSKGPTLLDHIAKPDIVAPGNRTVAVSTKGVSLLEKQFQSNMVGAAYFRMSGTSMATPVVSGAVALLLQKYPSLTPDQVKARLMKTATKSFPATSTAVDPATGQTYTSNYDLFTVGAGYLDIWGALNNTDVAVGSAL